MAKQSMQKGTGRAGGGGGESSTGTRKQESRRDGDYETALRLQKMLDEEDEIPDHRRHPHKEMSMDSRSPGRAGGRAVGGGEPFSSTRKQHLPRDSDYDTALRLQKMLDDEARYPDHRRHSHKEIAMDPRHRDKAAPSTKHSSRDSTAPPYPEKIQSALENVQKFVAEVMETTCYKCDSALMRDFNIQSWFKQWASTKGQPQPSSVCSLACTKEECQALTCLGCGQKPRMGKYTGKIDGFRLDWCCESGRIFALWSLLCEFDNLELAEQERSRRQVQESSRHDPKGSFSTNKKGTGYVAIKADVRTPLAFAKHEPLQLQQADSKTDGSTKQMLALIIELLPRRGDRNKAARPAMGSMIELSLVQDRIAELLRNDSLQDATTRAGLYFAVFEFFERLGKRPETSYLIYEERFVKKHSSGLFVISTSKDLKGKGKARAGHHLTLGQGDERTTSSLLACMSNMGKQSDALLKASQAVKNEFRTADAQDLLEVAARVAKLQLSMQPQSIVDRGTDGPGPNSDKDMTWQEYNQKYCMTREENILHKFFSGRLGKHACGLHHSPPNRIKRLVTEASEMATSLPPNIFVKIDDARPDVMKCLIIGPEGTPYEAGLFEFDIFCPLDYPQSPPNVVFRTRGGGEIRFNPNLHNDGQICLSLLNTFPGPPGSNWQGANSSILSVLVSIQAMIFCPDPWDNIPLGYERIFSLQILVKDSQFYKLMVQAYTVRYAMLDWLQNDEMREGLWRDVVRTYFERNGEAILGVVNRWRGANRHLGSGPGVDLGRELAHALQAFRQSRH